MEAFCLFNSSKVCKIIEYFLAKVKSGSVTLTQSSDPGKRSGYDISMSKSGALLTQFVAPSNER